MNRMLKRFTLLAALLALFSVLTVTAWAENMDDASESTMKFITEAQLVVYVDGEWDGALSDSYGLGETVSLTAPEVSGKQFSHWTADGSIISYSNPLTLTVNSHTTLYAVYAAKAPAAASATGFTSITRINDGTEISFQARADGTVTEAGIVYSTTVSGDDLINGGTGVTTVTAVKLNGLPETFPDSVLDSNNCWMLRIKPENDETVYHARTYMVSGGETIYGDVKDVKLSELDSGYFLIVDPNSIDPNSFEEGSLAEKLEELADKNDNGNDNSGGNDYSGGGTSTYAPTVSETKNGTVTVDPKAPKAGDKVTVTPKPDEGYEVDSVTVTDANGKAVEVTKNADGTYSYIQPAGKVTINATFKKTDASDANCPMKAFTDLDPKAWYHDGVHWALENGLMNGVGGGKFDPNGATTRAMIVTILYRLEGEPVIRSGMPFSDVKESDWYAKAVSWAESKGIVTGYGDGRFGPNDPITREQLAVILYRYAQTKGEGFKSLWSFKLDFPDAADVSDWATEAVSWMVMNGVINGKDGKLVPGGNASRAEAATMLQRFCEFLAK